MVGLRKVSLDPKKEGKKKKKKQGVAVEENC